MIRLINKNGVRKGLLVHRIVAKAFIPNPNNLPEVNHKDNNTSNPCASNLEWVTRKENMKQCFEKCSPIRNYNKCILYKNGIYIGSFKSICEAVRFANAKYGVSKTQLERNLFSSGIVIIPEKKQGKIYLH